MLVSLLGYVFVRTARLTGRGVTYELLEAISINDIIDHDGQSDTNMIEG